MRAKSVRRGRRTGQGESPVPPILPVVIKPEYASDIFFEVCRVAFGRRFQCQQPDIDAQQGLGDSILELMADLLPFILLRRVSNPDGLLDARIAFAPYPRLIFPPQ